jgi:hypothetical protein
MQDHDLRRLDCKHAPPLPPAASEARGYDKGEWRVAVGLSCRQRRKCLIFRDVPEGLWRGRREWRGSSAVIDSGR